MQMKLRYENVISIIFVVSHDVANPIESAVKILVQKTLLGRVLQRKLGGGRGGY